MNNYPELEEKFGGKFRETNMKDNDYKDKKVFWLEFNGATCPICGHKNWCMINVTGTKVICERQPNDHKLPNINGFLYYLSNDYRVDFNKRNYHEVKTFKRAEDSTLDLFYRAVLLGYPLMRQHRENLYKRGLTDEMIDLHGSRGFGSYYATSKETDTHGLVQPLFSQAKFSKKEDKIITNNVWINLLTNLREATGNDKFRNDLWHGVPGFSLNTVILPSSNRRYSSPIFRAPVGGLLVPYYNVYNELVGFQSRVDHTSLWATITKPLSIGDIKIHIDSTTREYVVRLCTSHNSEGTIIAEGVADSNIIDLDYGGLPYQFKIEEGGKYFWVSSSKDEGGAVGKMPIQVSYNPSIAALDPSDVKELSKIKDYIKQPKSVWLTEGGLKGYITSALLPKSFSDKKLDEVGRDVLAVAGVNSYRHFLPTLKKLNVKSVTCAYDMDFQKNEQVKDNYKSLIALLRKEGFKVRVASWNGDKAKGIDDALSQKLEIDFISPDN